MTARPTLRPPPQGTTLLYEKDSAYNYIQVAKLNGPLATLPTCTNILLLNEGQGIHSVYAPGNIYYGGTWDIFMAAPFFNAPPYSPQTIKSLCIIGLAAGTIAQLGYEQHGEVGDFADECERRIFAITEQKTTVSFEPVKPVMGLLSHP